MKRMTNTSAMKIRMTVLTVLMILMAKMAVADYTAVVAFGDSLTDHGGLKSYVPSALEVWSNGDTWVEYFADELVASLDNNAIAGAMTLGHEDAGVQAQSDSDQLPQLGLIGQVGTYIDSDPLFTPSRTLFTILIGGNDLLEFLRGEAGTDNPVVLVSSAMTQIQTAITDLYDEGAVNFLVLNLPDLATTPLFNTQSASTIANVRALTSNYNAALKALIGNLRNTLSGTTIHYFDTFAYLNTIIDENYFAQSEESYLTLDASYVATGTVNGPEEDYLFWDAIHPMTQAHEYLGKQAARSIQIADDDDSSCFVSTAPATAQRALAACIVLIMLGLGMGVRKR